MDFYNLDSDVQGQILRAHYPNAGTFQRRGAGFGGFIFWFDCGEGVFPRTIVAKTPKPSERNPPQVVANWLCRELRLQRTFHYHSFVHHPADFDVIAEVPVAWFRAWDHDLSRWTRCKDFQLSDRLALLIYLIDALEHCHGRGLIAHQDLKPENIFIRDLRRNFSLPPDARAWAIPKLADFGSANLAAEIGVFAGTAAYMSPEQWREEPLGRHTTAWSIGLLSYELISGGLHACGEDPAPWRTGENPAFNRWQNRHRWRRWINDGAPVPKQLDDATLQALVNRCLSLDPAQRPALHEIRAELCTRLAALDQDASAQTSLMAGYAAQQAQGDHDWPYRDERFERMERIIGGLR